MEYAKGVVVVRAADRQLDNEHGFVRGWGVSRAASGSEQISMAYGVLPAGTVAGAHKHPFETAIYIVSGKVRVRFGDTLAELVDVGGGDFLTIRPNVPHAPENPGPEPLVYLVARSAPEEIGQAV
jgi:uncharacterized RmlC-like cupin family protein